MSSKMVLVEQLLLMQALNKFMSFIGKKMLKEFKNFAIKGNVVDLAVGVIIGSAFGAIVKSLVDDIIMPPIGYLLGNVDFSNLFLVIKEGSKAPAPYATLADATNAGAVLLKYGAFANTIVSFMIVSFSVFLMINQLQKLKKEEPAATDLPPSDEVKLLSEIRDLLKK
jgi:large conductance mechanosensitive channel